MGLTFDEFCDKQMLGGEDRQAFKAWLGNIANAKMSHASWWKWFGEWVRCRD